MVFLNANADLMQSLSRN